MKTLQMTFLTALVVLGLSNAAFALGPCSAAQWSAADKSCAKVNGAGSCASSCQAVTEHTAIVGCEGGSGLIYVNTIIAHEIHELTAVEGEDGIDGEVVKDFKDIRIEIKATKAK